MNVDEFPHSLGLKSNVVYTIKRLLLCLHFSYTYYQKKKKNFHLAQSSQVKGGEKEFNKLYFNINKVGRGIFTGLQLLFLKTPIYALMII